MKKNPLVLIAILAALLLFATLQAANSFPELIPRRAIEGAASGICGPDGIQNVRVRFIRMEYDGPSWNDGMDEALRADLNFLECFRSLTYLTTASQPEAASIALLAKYPKGYAPPLVYMSADGKIDVSERDVRTMREYLAGGGMLFADCDNPVWHVAFQDFIARVFPGESLTKIPHDNVIFQVPFALTNGAPSVHRHDGSEAQGFKYKGSWPVHRHDESEALGIKNKGSWPVLRHDESEALGIKYKGRWVVFYHPGKLTAAWKNSGDNRSRGDVEGASEMGVNLIYYAYSNYMEITRKYRSEEGAASIVPRTPPRSPWAPHALKSIGSYDQTTPEDEMLQLIRKIVKQNSDLLAVMNKLVGVSFKTYDVTQPQTDSEYTEAIVLDITARQALVLIFEFSASLKKHTLLDSFLVMTQNAEVSVLLDVIPKAGPPQTADFNRVLNWYESRFSPLDSVLLKTILTDGRVENMDLFAPAPASANAKAKAVGLPQLELATTARTNTPRTSLSVGVARPEEIPRSPDDISPGLATEPIDDWASMDKRIESLLDPTPTPPEALDKPLAGALPKGALQEPRSISANQREKR